MRRLTSQGCLEGAGMQSYLRRSFLVWVPHKGITFLDALDFENGGCTTRYASYKENR